MANEMLGETKIANLRQSFAEFDANGNGSIEKNELRQLLKKLGHETGDEQFAEMFQKLDENHDGTIDFKEFCFLFLQLESDIEGQIKKAFEAFDKDGNGTISKEELGEVFKNLGIIASDLELNDVMALVDLDHDGKIDIFEFTKAYKELSLKTAFENNPDALKANTDSSPAACCTIV